LLPGTAGGLRAARELILAELLGWTVKEGCRSPSSRESAGTSWEPLGRTSLSWHVSHASFAPHARVLAKRVAPLWEGPGVHAVRALLGEETLEGLWFDRTQEYAARHRGQAFERLQYATPERLELAPLPAWKHLRPEIYRQRVAELVTEIVAEAAADREASGRAPLGPLGVQAQNAHDRPAKMKKSPAPFCHAASRWARKTLREAYYEFFVEFRDAAERWKRGDRGACFPVGSFPPGLPFVGG
jgi:hypothetical protein